MKTSIKFAMTLSLIVLTTAVFAQKDTTEIIIGKKRIVVIEKKDTKERNHDNLGTGVNTFRVEIDRVIEESEKIRAEIDSLQNLQSSESDETTDAQIAAKERELQEKEKQISAFEKGIEDLEIAMEKLEEELEKLEDMGDEDGIKIEDESNSSEDDEQNSCAEKFKGHWAGFEFGLANFLNPTQMLATDSELGFMQIVPERSFAYSLNLFEFNIPIHQRYFGLTTGAGINWSSYALAQNIDLEENQSTGIMEGILVADDVRHYEKNRFNNAYITIPLLAELQIPAGKHSIWINGGVTGSLRGWSKQKQEYYIDGQKYKDKFSNDYQLSAFRYGLSFRAGYGPIGIFADYSLAPLFKEGMGPELYPINVGIRLINF